MNQTTTIRKFIHGVTAGLRAKHMFHSMKDKPYSIGFEAGLRNQGNPAFTEQFLQFWLAYTQFISSCADSASDLTNEDD